MLSSAERHAKKVRVDITYVKNIFIPSDIKHIQKAVTLIIENKKRIKELEQSIDLAIFELYEINKVALNGISGIDIIERFLS